MVGSALVRRLEAEGCRVITADRKELDLREQAGVRDWFAAKRPEAVILAAARVGGIQANRQFPVEFLQDNLVIQSNVIDAAWRSGAEKLLFLGSSCIYPRDAEQPLTEDALLTGPLEETNQWYAVAKIAGIKLCQAYRQQYGADFISAMPTNLYGPGDNFHPENSHVPAALLRRFHEAKVEGLKQVTVWGTGQPLRDFLHVDDMADACVHLLVKYSGAEHINVGSGAEISIADFARMIADVVGYGGKVAFDTTRPDGTPRKILDNSRLQASGWEPSRNLRQGLESYYKWFLQNQGTLREVELRQPTVHQNPQSQRA